MSLRQELLESKRLLVSDLAWAANRPNPAYLVLKASGNDPYPVIRQRLASTFDRWTRSPRLRANGYIAVMECRDGPRPHLNVVIWGNDTAVPRWPIGTIHRQPVHDMPGLSNYLRRHMGSAHSVRRLRREGLPWLWRSRGTGRPTMVI